MITKFPLEIVEESIPPRHALPQSHKWTERSREVRQINGTKCQPSGNKNDVSKRQTTQGIDE